MRLGPEDSLVDLVQDLTELLEQHPEAKVRIAYQQTYPLRAGIVNVSHEEDLVDNDPNPEFNGDPDGANDVVWIAVGSSPYNENPYDVPARAWEA